MLNIIVVEDNKNYNIYLVNLINEILKKNNIPGVIKLAVNSSRETEEYLKTHSSNAYNVLFMDIGLENEDSGLALARLVRQRHKTPYIVFISERTDFVFQSFKVQPFNFLPKPVTEEVLTECLKDIYEDFNYNCVTSQDESTLVLKSGWITYTINKSEIVYIEKDGNKSIIYSLKSTVSTYETLEEILKKLRDDKQFVRCHKSYIANNTFIFEKHRDKNEIIFQNGMKCYIGRKFKKDVF